MILSLLYSDVLYSRVIFYDSFTSMWVQFLFRGVLFKNLSINRYSILGKSSTVTTVYNTLEFICYRHMEIYRIAGEIR